VVDQLTVQRYIDLLEKIFVIYRVTPFSRNLRKELNKKRKIYFTDLGIRNALIRNFNPMEIRQDVGALWENFCVTERIKYLSNQGRAANMHFWRNYDGKEIDLVEDEDGLLTVFEFKYGDKIAKFPIEFEGTYYDSIRNKNGKTYGYTVNPTN